MNKKLYVGNLLYEITQEDLRELFSKAGKVVDAVVISDKYTGRSKGFGFVEMETEEEAKEAVKMFNEKDYKGRNLTVNPARPKREGNDGGFQRRDGGRRDFQRRDR